MYKFIILFLYLSFVYSIYNEPLSTSNQFELSRHEEIEYENNNDDIEWDLLYTAICYVESRHDSLAKNTKSSALGEAQMLKIYVKDVNRICKIKKIDKHYSLEDRLIPSKCKEMFEIYQSHYNPNKDIHYAIQLHRGLKGEDLIAYKTAVLNKHSEYINQIN